MLIHKLIIQDEKSRDQARLFLWRRGRDSNPRTRFPRSTGLANQPLQPLGYLSVLTDTDYSLFYSGLSCTVENQHEQTAYATKVERNCETDAFHMVII